MKARWLVLVFSGVASTATAHKPTVTTFTYHADIYPIFEAKCGSCHRTAGVAPMSLLSYREAYPWAVSIKNEVLHLTMPPWYADERFGAFQHAGGLTAREVDTIVDWCLGGSPEGDPVARAPDSGKAGWRLGTPDVELAMPSPVVLDSATSEHLETLELDPALAADAFLSAIDFRPSAANVVRSATLSVTGSETPLATWIPGQIPAPLPEGAGRALASDATLTLRVHYKKTWLDEGSPVEDQSTLALYLSTGDVAPVAMVPVTARTPHTLSQNAELLGLLPRVDASVEALTAELVLPDGTREPILRLYQPDPGWPRTYWLERPLAVPGGARVELSATAPDGVEPVLFLSFIPR